MSTNKIVLREVEEFMSDYTPVYQPIYPLFLQRGQQYASEVGKLDFRRVETVGDIRAKHITPKDTDIQQIAVMEGKKTFKKYFLANQFQLSQYQDRQGVEEVQSRVLDEHHVQADELFLLGEGTTVGTQINNGLFLSSDPNYTLENSVQVALQDRMHDFYTKVVSTASKADEVAGQKVLFLYGSSAKALFRSLFPNSDKAFRQVLAEALPGYSFVEIPDAPTPSGVNGWIVANLDQSKLHYTALPQLLDQGHNREKMYLWFNFMLGSSMLEVLAKDGIIRQPMTLET